MRRALAAALTVLMFTACDGGVTPSNNDGETLSLPERGKETGTDKKDTERTTARSKDDAKHRKDVASAEDGNERPKSGAPEGSDPATDGGDGESRAEAMPLPHPGSYSYVQGGWEELCQGNNCDRSDLPPSQTVEISFRKRAAERAVFVSESEGSGSRDQTITYDVRPDGALITRLESTFSSGAFRFTAEIVPDPPVTAAIFPLEVGDGWSGRWNDRNGSVDGSYRFDVVGRDRMTIDGRAEDVVVVDTTMKLSGEYRGTNEIRLWVVADRFTIAASKGFTEIDSSYGTYRSRFTTSYRSGPAR